MARLLLSRSAVPVVAVRSSMRACSGRDWKIRLVNSAIDEDESGRPTPVDGWFAPARIANHIRGGGLPNDRLFDQLLPAEFRRASAHHWTPLRVAVRAGDWLEEYGARSVADIGSGVGKFCVVAALRCRAHFRGLEHRQSLVAAARGLATLFALEDRVDFEHTTFGAERAPRADAYYLFNPFAENLHAVTHRLDDGVEVSRSRFVREVLAVQRQLNTEPDGTLLLTYHGYGGPIPQGYELVREDPQIKALKLWCKGGPPQRAGARTR